MIVFDRDGNFLRCLGEGMFPRAHGVHMAPDDTIFCTDDGDTCVRKCTLDGKVLMTIGTPGKPAPFMSGAAVLPLHPHRAVAERRHLRLRRLRQRAGAQILARRQISDVVGRVRHRRGEFNLPAQHPLRRRWLGLCRRPREPSRAGVRRQRQIRDRLEQPASAERALHARHPQPICYIGELGPFLGINPTFRTSAAHQHSHQPASCWPARRSPAGPAPGPFARPTASRWSSHGDPGVGEVSYAAWNSVFPERPRPNRIRSLPKFVKV